MGDNLKKVTVATERRGFSIREFATQYGLSDQFVRLEIARGHLHALRCGGRVVLEASEIERYLSEARSAGTAATAVTR